MMSGEILGNFITKSSLPQTMHNTQRVNVATSQGSRFMRYLTEMLKLALLTLFSLASNDVLSAELSSKLFNKDYSHKKTTLEKFILKSINPDSNDYTFIINSENHPLATPLNPRILHFDNQGTVVSWTTHEGAQDSNEINVLLFDKQKYEFEFRKINFVSGAPLFSKANPAECMLCHGTSFGPMPIWINYNNWDNAMGAQDDIIDSQKEAYEIFLATHKKNPRLPFLKNKNFPWPYSSNTQADFQKAGSSGITKSRPNLRLGILLTYYQSIQLHHKLRTNKRFKDELFLWATDQLSDCFDEIPQNENKELGKTLGLSPSNKGVNMQHHIKSTKENVSSFDGIGSTLQYLAVHILDDWAQNNKETLKLSNDLSNTLENIYATYDSGTLPVNYSEFVKRFLLWTNVCDADFESSELNDKEKILIKKLRLLARDTAIQYSTKRTIKSLDKKSKL